MLTLPLATPTLLVEQGFAGVLTALRCIRFGSAATHWQPLCTMLFPRSPGFRFAAVRWSDACRNALFAGARTVQRLPRRLNVRSRSLRKRPLPRLICRRDRGETPARESSAVLVSGMVVLPQRRFRPAISGPAASLPRTANSAVFNNASLNAHIEWRFP
jgi:hypothetical protein